MALDNFRTIELIWDKANKSIIKTIKTASSDTSGRYFSVKVLDGGQEVTLNNAKLQLYWEHPNFNTSGTDDFNTVNNGGLFKMTFSDEMLTNIGELNAHLVLTLPDGKITSDGFPIEVIKGADSGVVVPTNGNGLVEQINDKIDKGNVTMNDLTTDVKLAMTGGSVAIVGENSVGTENVKDNSITAEKTTFFDQTRINLFDKTTITTPGIINEVTGKVVTTGALAPNFAASDYIPVTENQTYEIYYSGVRAGFAWYNDTSVAGYISGGYVTSTNTKHTSPAGAKYLRVTIELDFIDSAMVAKNGLPYNYVAYNDVGLNFQTPNQRKSIAQELLTEIESEINVNNKSESVKRFEGQLWSVVGDSITEKNFRATTHYHDHVSSWLGMTVDNQGYSGTGYLQTYNTSLKIPDRLDLVNHNSDLITVFAGTNDRSRNLGEFGDTDKDATIYGAIDYTLRKLIEKFPKKKIAVFTPTPTSTDWGVNNNRLQLIADAVIKTANHYSIPCLDLYRESGLRPWNIDNNKEFFSTTSVPDGDGLHMNDKGQLWIAYKIYEFFLTL